MDRVTLGESIPEAVSMFPDTPHQVAGHSDIEGPVATTGKDVLIVAKVFAYYAVASIM
jgi:hypothetical protein